MTIEKKQRFLINFAYIVTILIIAYIAIKYVLGYVAPFIIGAIVAVLLHRPVEFISQKTKLPRSITSVAMVVLALAVVFGLLILLFGRIYNELAGLIGILPDYIPEITAAFNTLNDNLSNLLATVPDSISTSLNQLPTKIVTEAVSYLTVFITDVAKAVGTAVPSILLAFVITVVACCFITIDYNKIVKFLHGVVPESKWKTIREIKSLLFEKVLKMIRGYAILMFITFCELSIALTILGVDYSVVLALIISVIDILPVLGTGTVLLPWALVSLLTGNYFWAIGLVVSYAVITVLRNILEPKIIGQQIGLHPLVMLLAIYLGLKLFGFFGMIALPLTLIVLMALYRKGNISFD